MRYRLCGYMGCLVQFNEIQVVQVDVREIERENNIIHVLFYCFRSFIIEYYMSF